MGLRWFWCIWTPGLLGNRCQIYPLASEILLKSGPKCIYPEGSVWVAIKMWNLWQNLSCGKTLLLLPLKLISDAGQVVLQRDPGKEKCIKGYFFFSLYKIPKNPSLHTKSFWTVLPVELYNQWSWLVSRSSVFLVSTLGTFMPVCTPAVLVRQHSQYHVCCLRSKASFASCPTVA